MGAATIARRFLDHIFPIRRSAEGIQEETEDPFLQRSLEIDEKIRSGKNRPLSKEEGQRFFDKIMRS